MTILIIVVLNYFGSLTLIKSGIFLLISIILFFIYHLTDTYDLYINKNENQIEFRNRMFLFLKPKVFKIVEINLLSIAPGFRFRNGPFIKINSTHGHFKLGVCGLSHEDSNEILETLKKMGCKIVYGY